MAPRRYRKLGDTLRTAFGGRVHKVGLWGGFSCPTRDGTLSGQGCVFCNPESSRPLSIIEGMSLREQLEAGIRRVRERLDADLFIAYLMDCTPTCEDPVRLESMFDEILSDERVVGLALGARPDSLPDPVLELLRRTVGRTFLSVEIGVQSASESSLAWMNRCHGRAAVERAAQALAGTGILASAHLILGLPGEGPDDVAGTAALIDRCGFGAVKIHNLQVLTGTPLGTLFEQGRFTPVPLSEYVDQAVLMLEHLPPRVIVQRLASDAPRRLILGPEWSQDKHAVRRAVETALESRGSWQGKALGHGLSELRQDPGLEGFL
ncbi:TIGR01212 family radical SAM protein [Candidatus Fermentibacterales bacterium]|nr:TIGR01212 family radical SAM protein [Candidatus Fermentibacterales bacterium]